MEAGDIRMRSAQSSLPHHALQTAAAPSATSSPLAPPLRSHVVHYANTENVHEKRPTATFHRSALGCYHRRDCLSICVLLPAMAVRANAEIDSYVHNKHNALRNGITSILPQTVAVLLRKFDPAGRG